MGLYVLQLISMFAILTPALCHPLDSANSTFENPRERINGNSSVCLYKDSVHADGEEITVDDPCLVCRCKSSALTCSLKICADILDPPPPGCYIVHKANECCPMMLCDTDKKESELEVRTITGLPSGMDDTVCIVNGSTFAEGSALKSSDICEYCYCIKGRQKCIKPKCSSPFDGCKAIYSRNSCCPTQYDCRGTTQNSSRIQQRYSGCNVDGVTYAEGDMILRNKSHCENCYCMKGEVHCTPVTCETDVNEDCNPIHTPGQCCPTSYVCSKSIMRISKNSIRSQLKRVDTEEDITAEGSEYARDTTITEKMTTSTELTSITNTQEEMQTESTTVTPEGDDTKKTRTESDTTDSETEVGFQLKNVQDQQAETTLEPTTEPSTTLPTIAQSMVMSNVLAESRKNVENPIDNRTEFPSNETSSPVVEEIFINSPQSDDDYDNYDYNEPRLPPSLPNLIIFPFVAADAVVKNEETTKADSYDKSSINRVGTVGPFYKDYFSPPTKTEGGFMPKQPPTLGNSYHEVVYAEKGIGFQPGHGPGSLIPSITAQPKPNSDQCLSKGRLYDHGELMPEARECQPCICYYGDVLCQGIVCPPVRKGCKWIAERDVNSCCGKVLCEAKELEDSQVLLEHPFLLEKATRKSFKSPATQGGFIGVSPDPFGDIIKTEPAPDLSSLMSDLLEHQTKKPVTVTYKNLVVDYYPDFLVASTRDDVKRKNYNNPVFYTTEINPFTNSISDKPRSRPTISEMSRTVTNSIQPPVTSSVSTSETYPEGSGSTSKLVKNSVRPFLTLATEPSRFLDFGTTSEEEPKPVTKRTRPPRPRPYKKTTEVPAKDDIHDFSKLSTKNKYPTKTKMKTPTAEKKPADDSFSLDSILRFFFDTDSPTPVTTVTKVTSSTRKTTKKEGVKKFTLNPYSTAQVEDERSTRETTTDLKYKDYKGREEPTQRNSPGQSIKRQGIGGLLKLAGCNIYGRMYRVGLTTVCLMTDVAFKGKWKLIL